MAWQHRLTVGIGFSRFTGTLYVLPSDGHGIRQGFPNSRMHRFVRHLSSPAASSQSPDDTQDLPSVITRTPSESNEREISEDERPEPKG
jgi:hypothetical protein